MAPGFLCWLCWAPPGGIPVFFFLLAAGGQQQRWRVVRGRRAFYNDYATNHAKLLFDAGTLAGAFGCRWPGFWR